MSSTKANKWGTKNLHFSTNVATYLGNGTIQANSVILWMTKRKSVT